MSLHCLFLMQLLFIGNNYFLLVDKICILELFLCMELPGNQSDVHTPKLLMYVNFNFTNFG